MFIRAQPVSISISVDIPALSDLVAYLRDSEDNQAQIDELTSQVAGLDNEFELLEERFGVDSIRRLIAHQEQSTATPIDFLSQILAEADAQQLFFDQKRRKTVDRMELRDQPILDQFQGSIFRLPLDRRLVLLGPPGAGKTTTLIRRLAQKRTEEALTLDEQEQLADLGLKSEFMSDSSWVMFSPTELLKLYVREAFNRESVPASAFNLRTWAAERIALGRDLFRFLKSASSGRFTLADSDDILVDTSSPAVAALFDELAEFAEAEVLAKCSSAIEWMERSVDIDVERISGQVRARFRTDPMSVDTVYSFAQSADFFKGILSSLNDQIASEEKSIANSLLFPDATSRLRALYDLMIDSPMSTRAGEEEDGDDLDEEESQSATSSAGGTSWDRAATAKVLLRLLRSLAEQAASNRTAPSRNDLVKLVTWMGDRRPRQEQLVALGRRVQVRKRIRVLEGAGRDLVFNVASVFVPFRRNCANRGLFYGEDAGASKNSTVISPLEADSVILLMLKNARRVMQRVPDLPWLKPIAEKYFMQLYVDEATDFSAVQLACMVELTHPKLRSWFACGDFRQRITSSGITSLDEIEWIRRVTQAPDIEVREISSEYRQSPRLKLLAQALTAERDFSSKTPTSNGTVEDPAPLLGEGISGLELATWLAARILEVERLVGRLPSIAVFVDSEESIDQIVKDTASVLAERNVQIVGCRDGRDVGNSEEVRVFDIRHIKGLEFEAVFFVGVDVLARRMPDLFQRFLYVGVTRAATFLGITCSGALPEKLESIRPLLSTASWE